MLSTATTETAPASARPRIYLEDTRCIGKVFVRCEYATPYGLACTIGCARLDTHRGRVVVADLHWIYDEAPDEVEAAARECLVADAPYEVAEFAEYETTAQMDTAMESERYAAYVAAMDAQWRVMRAAGAVR